MMKQFINFIKLYIDPKEEDLKVILSFFKERSIGKNRFILKQGKKATDYFFIVSGGFRICYDYNGSPMTAWIALENTFFTDLLSLKEQAPSRFDVQAIEDSVLLTIKHDKMEKLYKRFPQWQEFGRKVWEDAFLNVVNGAIRFQSMTAEERYLSEMQQPEFLKRIPLKQIASYLGITPTSLSRLRKKIK